MIDGILLTPLNRINHLKGDVFHAMKSSSEGFFGFGEAYFSTVNTGSIKGWKRHLRATLNLIVISGKIKFVILKADLPNSDVLRENLFEIELGPSGNYSRLTVQPGLWVAFKGEGEDKNILLNISSQEHDPDEADNVDLASFPYVWSD
jgi:dTDP-4-dehydrorhamnose 3,5-epimerase